MTVQAAGEIAVQAVFWSSLAFIAAVSFFWPWWKTQLGWTVVAKSLALAIATFQAMIFYWLGTRPPAWLTWVSVAALGTVPLILAWRLAVLWHVQRTARQIL